ncbi:hypothetical protein THAOC_29943, partial [Thalassiosira oceanica]
MANRARSGELAVLPRELAGRIFAKKSMRNWFGPTLTEPRAPQITWFGNWSYGRQELWSHGFGARPVSDGPYQPVDAADVQRRVAFGASQDNEFAVRHCCVHRLRWPVVSGARVPRGTSKPLVTTSSASKREEAVRPQIEFSAVALSPEKDLQHRLEVLALATDGEESCPMEGRPFQRCRHSVECVSVGGLGFLRSIGRNKLFSHPPIPGFVTGNWLYLAFPCLDSFDNGDPAGPAQGRAVLAFPGPVGPLAGPFFPEWAARAHLPTIQTKHAAPRHLLAPPEMITGADTNRRHGIVSALSRRSCRAAGGSRRPPESRAFPTSRSTIYLDDACSPSRANGLATSNLRGLMAHERSGDQGPNRRNPRIGAVRLASAKYGILPYCLVLATILAVKWAS